MASIWLQVAAGACVVNVTASGGASNQLQVRPPGKAAWQDVGAPLVGDGAIDAAGLVTPRQTYQARVLSTAGAVVTPSDSIGLTHTPADDPVAFRAMCRIAERLIAADLPGIGRNVYKQLVEDATNAAWPAVLLTCPQTERVTPVDQHHYHVSYPVSAFIADRVQPEDAAALVKYQGWRAAVMDELMRAHHADPATGYLKALPGVPEVLRTEYEPGPQLQSLDEKYQFIGTGMTLWCLTEWKRTGAP